MSETWKPVVGYEGYYEVSDHGRVRSLERLVTNTNGVVQRRVSRAIKGRPTMWGHLRVNLYRGGKKVDVFVHRLVLEAFEGPCPDGMEGCHNNGDPADNRLGNLRWDTAHENHLDRVTHGVHHEARKTHCPQGHPYEGNNLVITKDGWRKCRECHRVRSAERHSRRAASSVRGENR